MGGYRRPIQMELVGGKPARQRIWEQIRLHADCFEIYPIARRAEADDYTVTSYLQCLVNGGYVVKLSDERFDVCQFQLIKNTGIEAPRLDRKGNPVTMGEGQRAMWVTIRILRVVSANTLVDQAEKAGIPLKLWAAKSYIKELKKAGYFQVVQKAGRKKGQLETVRLLPHMDTGPRPPMIQRVGVVYDPNINKVMHADDPQEAL